MKKFAGFPTGLADFWFELYEKNTVQDAEKIRERYKVVCITEPLTCLYGAFLPTALDAILAAGFEIIGEDYKTDHFPTLADDSAKLLMNKKSFHIGKRMDVNQSIFTAELADEIGNGFRQMKELFRILEG